VGLLYRYLQRSTFYALDVDHRRWPKPSPSQISLAPGNYRIVVEKGDLKAAQKVEIRDGDLKHLSISLSQQ
jgi:hypothetical protein